MSDHMMTIEFKNNTKNRLELDSRDVQLNQGAWISAPTTLIPPGEIGFFNATSIGSGTGVSGRAGYYILDENGRSNIVLFSFSNPYNGQNSYDGTAPEPYHLSWTGDQQNDATVVYTLTGP